MADHNKATYAEIAEIILRLESPHAENDPRDHGETDIIARGVLESMTGELEAGLGELFQSTDAVLRLRHVEIRKGSLLIILHVIGDIVKWTADVGGTVAFLTAVRKWIVDFLRRQDRQILNGYHIAEGQTVIVKTPRPCTLLPFRVDQAVCSSGTSSGATRSFSLPCSRSLSFSRAKRSRLLPVMRPGG